MDVDLFFKKDFLQYTGSFKERGARYTLKMLSEAERKAGVVAASAGNHALALSYHGSDLGIPITVVMPESAPIMKVEACKTYNATVMNYGVDLSETKTFAMDYAQKHGMLYINGYGCHI
jgi:threonine dehydratase